MSMEDIYVGRILSTSPQTVSSDTLVADAAQLMLENDVGSVVVTDDDGHLDGILTATDFVTIVSKSKPKAETSVSQYMTTDVVTTTAQEPIRAVAETMVERGFHHMPVVDETEGVIGVVTTTDLTAYFSHAELPNPV